ncbi:MAG TPA: hypothetical protein VGR07_16295 [Thermoanaerobaculia bacterium]|jgi:hypothetical protein|nr:hypothetical protein [Thermoanaerobaculia bacterium]
MGGTEILRLVPHEGTLYAATSTVWDAPGTDPALGAQILALDHPEGPWRVEHEFPVSQWRATLGSVRFSTDGRGRPLAAPVSLLLAAPVNPEGHAEVWSRDADGRWASMRLASGAAKVGIRSLHLYRDQVTGVDRVFAGCLPYGIWSGVYEPAAPGLIRWDREPELSGFQSRPMAFAECAGALYAAIKPHLYRRIDGERSQPRWRSAYVYATDTEVAMNSSGLRGLTPSLAPAGPGEVLLAALEGARCRIVRIAPEDDHREEVDLDVLSFLRQQWGGPLTYAIAAYDDMVPVRDPASGEELLVIGLGASRGPLGVRHPREGWEPGGFYLLRRRDGSYRLRQIVDPELDPMPPLVAVRTCALSPFDGETLFFGGYDPNAMPAHHTAWIFSAPAGVALR